MPKTSIRNRRRRKRLSADFELQLTSMMDVLVIIVVFLLKSSVTSTNSFSTVAGLTMPTSNAQESPPDSLQVIITPEGMTVDNERIVEFVQTQASVGTDATYAIKKTDLDEGNRRVRPLYDSLVKAREKAEILKLKSGAKDAQGKPVAFDGVLAIQADKRVHYDTIRKIMYTAATAGYKTFRFLAMKRET